MTDIVKPSQYQIFKGSAAARFQLERPTEPFKVGCVYLQVAPSKGKVNGNNTYAWEDKKISVKFGINDLTILYHRLKSNEKIELFHDFGDFQKIVGFTPKEDGSGYFLGITEIAKSDKTKKQVSIPVSSEEISTLVALFFYAIPAIHNWL